MQKLMILAAVALSVLIPQAQKGAPAKQAEPSNGEKAYAYLATATMNWEKASTNGMHAEMIEFKKVVEKGQSLIDYRIKVTGAPRFQKYSLLSWPITYSGPVTVMEGLMIDANGAVGCPAHSNDSCSRNFDGVEIVIKYAPAKGEIYRNALVSKDQKSRIFFSIVPDPLTMTDRGCTLEVIRLQPAFELVLVNGRGFQPSEQVAFHSKSLSEIHNVQAQADQRGQFWAPFTPFTEGKNSGAATVSATGGRCAPAVTFNWGTGQ